MLIMMYVMRSPNWNEFDRYMLTLLALITNGKTKYDSIHEFARQT